MMDEQWWRNIYLCLWLNFLFRKAVRLAADLYKANYKHDLRSYHDLAKFKKFKFKLQNSMQSLIVKKLMDGGNIVLT